MLGHWRVVLRQAEESARAGRYDEALALANRPDVADHRQALALRDRLAIDLVGRGQRRARADDLKGALVDLDLGEQFGAAPDRLAEVRQEVAGRVADEVRALLDAGDPARTLERIDELGRHKVGGPALRRIREAADAWQSALDNARRGEFGAAYEHLDRAERLAGDPARPALAAARRDLELRQKQATPKVESLYRALSLGGWSGILSAAEAVLEQIPEHPAAKQARGRAWQQIAAISPSASPPQRLEPVAKNEAAPGIVFLDDVKDVRPARKSGPAVDSPREPLAVERVGNWANAPRPQKAESARCPICGGGMSIRQGLRGNYLGCHAYPRCKGSSSLSGPVAGEDVLVIQEGGNVITSPRPAFVPPPGQGTKADRFVLWADILGGYLVCLDDEVVIGRAGPDAEADIPILGDLSRRHASIVRDGDGYLLKAYQATWVNHRKADIATLHDGDVIRLGPSVELEFRQPSPVSATARLRLLSRHRLPMAVDGIVMMAETCILGPSSQAHLPAPDLESPVVLYRQGPTLWCRGAGTLEIDGRSVTSRGPLKPDSRVRGDGFSFSLEPLDRARPGAIA